MLYFKNYSFIFDYWILYRLEMQRAKSFFQSFDMFAASASLRVKGSSSVTRTSAGFLSFVLFCYFGYIFVNGMYNIFIFSSIVSSQTFQVNFCLLLENSSQVTPCRKFYVWCRESKSGTLIYEYSIWYLYPNKINKARSYIKYYNDSLCPRSMETTWRRLSKPISFALFRKIFMSFSTWET